jgi:hypothetical protein
VTAFRLTWKGPNVQRDLDRAIEGAMNDTTAAAAIQAKRNHSGWRNVTGTAEGSIRGQPARKSGRGWSALFGSFDVDYFIWLEIGARGRAGDRTLRRAADVEFPKLAGRVAANARRMGATDR